MRQWKTNKNNTLSSIPLDGWLCVFGDTEVTQRGGKRKQATPLSSLTWTATLSKPAPVTPYSFHASFALLLKLAFGGTTQGVCLLYSQPQKGRPNKIFKNMLQENGTLIISLEKISYSKSRHRLRCLTYLELATGHPVCSAKSLQYRHYDTSHGHQVLRGSCRSKQITINLLQQTVGPAQ